MATATRGYCQRSSVPVPLARSGANTATLRVAVASPITLTWTDGTTDTYDPASTSYSPACLSAYDPTLATWSVDARQSVWLVVATHGIQHLLLIEEQDYATAGTLIGAISGAGAWAPLWRINGDQIDPLDQHQLDTSSVVALDPAATPDEGDLLYYHSGKWELIHISATPRDVLNVAGSDPAWDHIANVLLSLIPYQGDIITNNAGTVVGVPLPGVAPDAGKIWAFCCEDGTAVPQWVQIDYP